MADVCVFVDNEGYAGTRKAGKFKKNDWAGWAVGRLAVKTIYWDVYTYMSKFKRFASIFAVSNGVLLLIFLFFLARLRLMVILGAVCFVSGQMEYVILRTFSLTERSLVWYK